MMNRTELTMDQMEAVVGGTQAEADALLALAKEKGWVKILHGKEIGYISADYLKFNE